MLLPPGRRRVAAIVTTSLMALTAACGGDDGPRSDAERFCGEAVERQALIVAPPINNEAELEATLEFYRLMGELAPLAIAEEWHALVVNLETASTIVPGDPESEQIVAMTAYATERSAYEVREWLEANCGVRIPITTIAPQDPVLPTSTVPPTSVPDDSSSPAGSTPDDTSGGEDSSG